jgi:hypothetical protein
MTELAPKETAGQLQSNSIDGHCIDGRGVTEAGDKSPDALYQGCGSADWAEYWVVRSSLGSSTILGFVFLIDKEVGNVVRCHGKTRVIVEYRPFVLIKEGNPRHVEYLGAAGFGGRRVLTRSAGEEESRYGKVGRNGCWSVAGGGEVKTG